MPRITRSTACRSRLRCTTKHRRDTHGLLRTVRRFESVPAVTMCVRAFTSRAQLSESACTSSNAHASFASSLRRDPAEQDTDDRLGGTDEDDIGVRRSTGRQCDATVAGGECEDVIVAAQLNGEVASGGIVSIESSGDHVVEP